ncbi:MAG TPA: diguanylate cyclase, partial [Candidatus Dormibacteraeota bacterium]
MSPALTALIRRQRSLLLALLAWAAVALLLGAWLVFGWGGRQRTQQIDDIAEFLAAFIAGAACLLAAGRHRGRSRLAWTLISLSATSWGAGQVVWSYYELVKGEQAPFPSFADLGYLLAVPLAIGGVLCFPTAASRATSLIRTALDGLVIAGSLLVVSWATVLGTVYRLGTGGVLAQMIGLAYPAGDVMVGTMILVLASRAARSMRLPLLLLAGGLLANLLADSGFAFLTTTNSYGPGNPVDVGWVAGYLLVGIAAWRARSMSNAASQADAVPERVLPVLPYLPVAAAAITAVIEELQPGELDAVIFWGMMFVVVLVVFRQFLMLVDNQALNRQLESNAVALRHREEHFRSLVQNSSDVITLIDQAGRIEYQSSSVERIFGYQSGQLVGTPFSELVHSEDRNQALRRIEEAINIEGPPISVECRLRRDDGSFCISEITITNLLKEPTVNGLVLNTRDISERKALEEKLTHQAFHDSLTNLPNRAAFRVVLDHAVHGEEHRRIAVLFLDLDDFKVVNDTLGHEAGDQLLAAVAKRIEATLRPGDSVARLGGDEFAVLLKNMEDESIARRVADRITRQLSTPFAIEGREVFVHASIGIAALVSGEEAAEDLLKNADVAMYIAKARGKGR